MIRLRSDAELALAFSVMKQLRPHIPDEKEFIARVREGEEHEEYALFGLEEGGELVALCGVQPMVTLYFDRCLWVSDLVTDDRRRSRGYGAKLLGEVETWARENGYREISLSSGMQRKDAHRFYLDKMGYAITSYQFKKTL